MTPALRRSVHAAVLAVAVTGLPLVWTRYAAPTPEELDPPAFDATSLHLHVLAAPLLVFILGALWPSHVLPHLRSGRQRATGVLLLVLGLVMIGSGYGLQVAIEEAARTALGWTHAVSSGAWLLVFVLHCALARRSRGDEPEAAANPAPPATTAW